MLCCYIVLFYYSTNILLFYYVILLIYYYNLILCYYILILSYYYIIISLYYDITIFSYLLLLSIIFHSPKQLHMNDGKLLNNVICKEFRRATFPCFRKQRMFIIFGPKAPGAHGTLMPIDIF